ncbi:MAG: recombinase family protein [Rubrivivax sp.]|nr:recombinase family protein [Rubrivivax sp.]
MVVKATIFRISSAASSADLVFASANSREFLGHDYRASASMRAVAYVRASDKANPLRVEAMLDEQRESIRQWAESRDFELVAVFEDRNSSANDLRRPAFRALLQLASETEPGFAAILLYGGDRWSRNILRSVDISHALEEAGVALLTMPMEYRARWPAPAPVIDADRETSEVALMAMTTVDTFYDDLLRLSYVAGVFAALPRKALAKIFRDFGPRSDEGTFRIFRLMDQVEVDFNEIRRKLGHPLRRPFAKFR